MLLADTYFEILAILRGEWPETRPAPDGNDSIPILAGQRAACSNTVYLAHWLSSPRCLRAGHLPPSSRPHPEDAEV